MMLFRFLIPIHSSPDIVEQTKYEVETVIPGTKGRKGYADAYTYVLKPGSGDKAFQYQYQDPNNRLTTWATGLSVTVSHSVIFWPSASTRLLTSTLLHSCTVFEMNAEGLSSQEVRT